MQIFILLCIVTLYYSYKCVYAQGSKTVDRYPQYTKLHIRQEMKKHLHREGNTF